MKATQLYDSLLEENPNYKLEYEKERKKKEEARTALDRVQLARDHLQQQVQDLQHQLRRSREGSIDSIQVQTPARRSEKFPHPSILTDGKEPQWNDWISQMSSKLKINQNHFDNEIARIAYVKSRTGGKAAKVIYARSHRLSSDPYQTVDEILDDLQELFEDSDREANRAREYEALEQKDLPFSDFYQDFRRLAMELSVSDKAQLRDMDKKLAPRLRTA